MDSTCIICVVVPSSIIEIYFYKVLRYYDVGIACTTRIDT